MSDADDYNDIFDRLRKFFKFDSGMFDMDFFIMPQSGKNEEEDPEKKRKAYKISYHFDSNKKEPEIKIDCDIDQDKLKEYFKNLNFPDKNIPNLPLNAEKSSTKSIDANEFSLDPCPDDEDACTIEPFAEINESEGLTEIIFEAPGIEL